MSRLTYTEQKGKNAPSNRTPTGDSILDLVLGGGFPKNRVIYITGNPGTGKTSLAAAFIYKGVKDYDECGLYVSLCETKDIFYSDMKTIGLDFESLEEDQKFEYLELSISSELEMGRVSDKIVNALVRLRPKRLVIDSFSLIAQAQNNPYKAREIMDTIFRNLVSSLECTTLVIGEQPSGESRLGIASEEFVSDGVLNLKHAFPREIEIRKMRGTKIRRENMFYTIGKNGFQTVRTHLSMPDSPKPWKPIPDSGDLLSSGSPDLDRIMGGGFPRGAYVVVEAGGSVTLEESRLLSDGTAMNFISQERGVIFSTTGGEATDKIRNSLLPYLPGEGLNQYLRVVEYNKMRVGEPIPRKRAATTSTPDELGFESRMGGLYEDLKKVTHSQPLFQWVGNDTLSSSFSMVPESKITRQIETSVSENRNGRDLTIAFARPSLRKLDALLDTVNWHLKIWKENGVLLLQGVKPETHLYAADSCVDLGYPVMCLTELD
jgi:KaiC/GvpD/RAD55 family RecA-like ATPase